MVLLRAIGYFQPSPSLEMIENVTQVPRAAHRLPPEASNWLVTFARCSSAGHCLVNRWSTPVASDPPINVSVSREQVFATVNESRCQLGRLYLIAVDILPKSSIDIWVDDEGRMLRTIKTDNEVLRVRKL